MKKYTYCIDILPSTTPGGKPLCGKYHRDVSWLCLEHCLPDMVLEDDDEWCKKCLKHPKLPLYILALTELE